MWRQGRFEIAVDRGFAEVMRACAPADRDPDDPGTWITPEIIESYAALHARGLAHSVEAWRDGRLVGGLYGVALGGAFFGESMFHRETDASKVALVALVERLRDRGYQAARHAVVDAAPRAVRRDRDPARASTCARLERALRLSCEFRVTCGSRPASVDGVGFAERERRDPASKCSPLSVIIW